MRRLRHAPLSTPPSLSSLKWECVIVALNGSREKVNGFNSEKHNWASSESCSGLQQHADEGVTMEENATAPRRERSNSQIRLG